MNRYLKHGALMALGGLAGIFSLLPGCVKSTDPPGPPAIPIVVTLETTGISSTSAISGGKVLSRGSEPLTARGVCWSQGEIPNITDSKTDDGIEVGTFSSILTGLEIGTTYVVRAYAINPVGVAYGDPVTFTTVTLPTVVSLPVTDITSHTAVSGGNVLHCGGASVTRKGVCWNTAGNPTVQDSCTVDGKNVGSFKSLLQELSAGTVYHVRAFATNSFGTNYGEELIFKTL